MKRALRFSLVLLILAAAPGLLSGDELSGELLKLHKRAIIFDAHCDTAMRLIRDETFDLGDRHENGHMDLPRMIEGGLDAQIFACWPSPDHSDKEIMLYTLQMIDAVWEQADKHGDKMEIALKGNDVRRIVDEGKIAVVLGIEGGHAIQDDLRLLRNYHRLGVRCMTLTWNNTNNWADSSTDTMMWGGLNELGREVVREMDRLGMVIDCSHVSDSTFFDVLEVTKNPVLVSHSCMRSLADVPRNANDEMLRALKENGGVICLNYFPGFLDKEYFDKMSVLWEEAHEKAKELAAEYGGDRRKAWEEIWPAMRDRAAQVPRPELPLLIDHVDYAVSIVGADHVGLGSDFDGISTTPIGLEDVSRLPAITAELAKRGYSDGEIEKILGGNLLRLVEQVCR